MRRTTLLLVVILLGSIIFYSLDEQKSREEVRKNNPTSQVSSTLPLYNSQTKSCSNVTLSNTNKNLDGKVTIWNITLPNLASGSGKINTKVFLNLTNKSGSKKDSFTYTALVEDPNGTLSTATNKTNGNAESVLEYPDDFPGAATSVKGVYTVLYTVNRETIGCSGFVVE